MAEKQCLVEGGWVYWHPEPDDPFTDFEAERAHEVLLNDGNPPPECLDVDDEETQDRVAQDIFYTTLEMAELIDAGYLAAVIGPEPQFPPLVLAA